MKGCWHRFTTYWKQLPIEGRGSIAVCIPLMCLIGTVVAYTVLRQRMVESQTYVDHTNQILTQSKGSLISILNAETGVRGYFIGKDKTFLESYNLALKTLTPTLSGLEQLVKDNPAQLQRAKLLTQVANERMNLLKQSVSRVDAGEIGTAQVTRDRLLNGKQAMDRFRKVISELEAEEYRLLDIRTRELQQQQQLNADAMWCGIAIGIIGTILAIRILQELAKELRERDVRLRESRSQVEAIVGNIVDGVILIDPKGRIESFNHAAVKMFGYQPNEVIGWDWKQLLNSEAEDTRKLLHYEPELLAKAPPIGQIWQAMGQRKNGELFPIEVSMNSIAFDDDRIAIVRDITDRQQAAAKLQAKAVELAQLNASLNASNYSLRQTNSELDRFAYVTAHDLKAPLRAIASLSEWVEEDLAENMSEETRSQMQLLRRRVYRMQALLNSLLEYSRAGRTQSPIVTVDVHRMLEKVIQMLSPPETFNIKIVTPMPTFDTRWRPLEQVLTHLIDNAIRHHPTKAGIVEISAIDLGDRYEFSIFDNGDGIEPQFQTRIYTIFQTLKARDLQENIGAGLAIVKKIVTSEGGTIELESMPGEGAIFRFTWLKQPMTIDASITTPEPRSKTSC
ncbi:sensor histidine kinase [Chamaesiphon minutus]|uniref:histidine kinase n=1 Tax=Chamaesiphon minutus (strain ATCC 27169 / PCC 6605) TaxID=1173020 RepID=K9UG63_CHAP6|nr:CHASE3 domain-containing protein [Chamaesiphon minutus]AFY93775.1 PAS domain S-box [Chamaesiphon minutus PCC 6605]